MRLPPLLVLGGMLVGACGSRTELFAGDLSGAVPADAAVPCTVNSHPDVVLELVVDESGSMYAEGKWEALRDSLLAMFAEIAAANDPQLSVGLVTFDDIAAKAVDPAPLTQGKQLGLLRSVIDRSTPSGGGTATLSALTAAYAVVDGVANARRVVVLLSDGRPTRGVIEQRQCEDLVAKERSEKGSQLFSVGIGEFPSSNEAAYDPSFMGRLAVAGGTAPTGCVPASSALSSICHFQVTPGGSAQSLDEQLGAALTAIRNEATTCP